MTKNHKEIRIYSEAYLVSLCLGGDFFT